MTLTIRSFGYLHTDDGAAPEGATITLDLRRLLRDPHTDPAMRELTGAHPRVQAKVMATPGARETLAALDALTTAAMLAAGPSEPVTVQIGCAGGRHRSYVIASMLASVIADRRRAGGALEDEVALMHLHAHLPVVAR